MSQLVAKMLARTAGTKMPTAEGPDFAAVMAAARALQPDDDALLKTMTPVLDSLYKTYSSASGA